MKTLQIKLFLSAEEACWISIIAAPLGNKVSLPSEVAYRHQTIKKQWRSRSVLDAIRSYGRTTLYLMKRSLERNLLFGRIWKDSQSDGPKRSLKQLLQMKELILDYNLW